MDAYGRRHVIADTFHGEAFAQGYSDNLATARKRADRLGARVIDLTTDTDVTRS